MKQIKLALLNCTIRFLFSFFIFLLDILRILVWHFPFICNSYSIYFPCYSALYYLPYSSFVNYFYWFAALHYSPCFPPQRSALVACLKWRERSFWRTARNSSVRRHGGSWSCGHSLTSSRLPSETPSATPSSSL